MKATAIAHPIQGLIKYHGLADFQTRQPLHDSISVCVAPLSTSTTVQPTEDGEDAIEIDGVRVHGRARERACNVLDAVRKAAGQGDVGFRVVSRSSFPQGVGLGSSSSGFAALAHASQAALQLDLDRREVARIARLGAGSATRAVAGGLADWYIEETEDGFDSTARMLAGPSELDWPIVVALVDHEEATENVHRDVMASPLLEGRRGYVEGALDEMRQAIEDRDRKRIFALAERDTLNLHAITMTGDRARVTWQPATVAVMRTLWRLREEQEVPAWFSIDTGATPYVNTLPGHADMVAEHLAEIEGVDKVLRGRVGGPVRLVEEHLF